MIQRRTPITRSAPPRKRRPGPPRRGPSEVSADQWRNPSYLAFLRAEGRCVACPRGGRVFGAPITYGMNGVCDPAHGPVNGRGSKGPDAGAIPLCRAHHDRQHAIGWTAMEVEFEFSREREAAVWFAAFKILHEGGEA